MNTLKDFIQALVHLFSGETSALADAHTYVDAGELIYNSGFSALKMATKLPTDFYASHESAEKDFANCLKQLSTKFGQKVVVQIENDNFLLIR